MTHAPEFIVDQPDKVVRTILYVCWIATFNTPEHHMGLGLAQSQVRCMLFACHDGRNAHRRDEIDRTVEGVETWIGLWRTNPLESRLRPAVALAEQLARLRDMAVTP